MAFNDSPPKLKTRKSGASYKMLPYQVIISAIALATVTLACALGASGDPIFTPPPGQVSSVTTESPTATTAEPVEVVIDGDPVEDPIAEVEPAPQATATPANLTPILYPSQSGDTLPAVAVRFGVGPEEIYSPDINPLPETAFLPPNTWLIIPHRLGNTTSAQKLLPDSEVIFSPSAINFDVSAYVKEAGGYLSSYKEYLRSTGNTSGADVIVRVATENSINPRLLLALLEYQSGWVYGQPGNLAQQEYPMGLIDLSQRGLYQQLIWAVNELGIGYYGWREGLLTDLYFSDGVTARIAPDLNAGTAALQYFFSKLYNTQSWISVFDPETGFPAVNIKMFGDPWVRSMTVEPLYTAGLEQPPMILPFLIGQSWSYTGGPHGAWEHEGARAAIDFAPGSMEAGCVTSDAWITSVAPGLVVRSKGGVVVVDLDGDGYESTGWAVLYLHVATRDRVPVGTQLETGEYIGHPSCEGGVSTGTHLHIARKYNGEWIAADGPIPFNLDGWEVHAGADAYLGTMTRNGETITASRFSAHGSRILRDRVSP